MKRLHATFLWFAETYTANISSCDWFDLQHSHKGCDPCLITELNVGVPLSLLFNWTHKIRESGRKLLIKVTRNKTAATTLLEFLFTQFKTELSNCQCQTLETTDSNYKLLQPEVLQKTEMSKI